MKKWVKEEIWGYLSLYFLFSWDQILSYFHPNSDEVLEKTGYLFTTFFFVSLFIYFFYISIPLFSFFFLRFAIYSLTLQNSDGVVKKKSLGTYSTFFIFAFFLSYIISFIYACLNILSFFYIILSITFFLFMPVLIFCLVFLCYFFYPRLSKYFAIFCIVPPSKSAALIFRRFLW